MSRFPPRLIAVILLAALLASCGPVRTPAPTPTVTITPSPSPVFGTVVAPTLPPRRTPTAVPPSDTPSPTLTATITSTLVPATPAAFEGMSLPPGAADQPITQTSAAQVAQLAMWGSGAATGVLYAPSGALFAVLTPLGAYVYDTLSGAEKQFIVTPAAVTAGRFTSDSAILALGLQDGSLELHNVADGSLLQSFSNPPAGPVTAIALPLAANEIYTLHTFTQTNINSTGDLLILRSWSRASGQEIKYEVLENIHRAYFTGDGEGIAQYTNTGLDVLSLQTGETLYHLDLKDTQNQSVAATNVTLDPSDSLALVSSGSYAALQPLSGIGATNVLQRAESLLHNNRPATCPPLTPVEGVILTGTPTPTDEYDWWWYDTPTPGSEEAETPSPTPTATRSPDNPPPVVTSAAFSPDGSLLAIGRKPGKIDLRKLPGGLVISTFRAGTSQIAFSPDGKHLLTLADDQTVAIYSVPGGHQELKLSGAMTVFNSLAISPGGNLIAAGGEDGLIRGWNLSSGRRVFTLALNAGSLAFSPDGKQLAIGEQNGDLVIWPVNQETGQRAGKGFTIANRHFGAIQSVVYTPDGKRLITGGNDCAIKVLQVGSWTTALRIPPLTLQEAQATGYLSVSPDGSLLAGYPSTQRLNAFHFFDLQTGENLLGLPLGPEQLFRITAWSPKDPNLIASTGEKTILWQLPNATQLFSVDGQGESLAFSTDGALLAIGMVNGTVRILSVPEGKVLADLAGHRGDVVKLAFMPDSHYLVSASSDGTVRVWGLP